MLQNSGARTDEEFTEFKTEVHANNRALMLEELADVAIAAIFGATSLRGPHEMDRRATPYVTNNGVNETCSRCFGSKLEPVSGERK